MKNYVPIPSHYNFITTAVSNKLPDDCSSKNGYIELSQMMYAQNSNFQFYGSLEKTVKQFA